jgi:ABC-type polysaccharide/polyol phosphate export permease
MSLARVAHWRDLLRELVVRDMKIRYEGTVLGFLWTLVNPLLFVGVFFFVFQVVLTTDVPRFTSFTLIGILVYSWFQASLVEACWIARSNRDLVRRPQFNVAVLPLVAVMGNLVHLLLAFPILLVIVVVGGSEPNAALVFVPVAILVQFTLTAGLAYFAAASSVLFRDTGYLIDVLLKLFFFITPIFYEAERVPQEYQWLYRLNPMVTLLEAYRNPLLHGTPPSLESLWILGAIAAIALLGGYKLFTSVSHRFAEEL